jgi:AraC-like DNA-binding protein
MNDRIFPAHGYTSPFSKNESNKRSNNLTLNKPPAFANCISGKNVVNSGIVQKRKNNVQIFIHSHTWKTAEPLQGLRISSVCEHYTLSPRISRNYNLPFWAIMYICEGKCIHSSSPKEKTYHQTSSQALLCPPNTGRYEHRIGQNKSHAAYILFHDSKNSLLKRLSKNPNGWTLFDDDNDKTLGSLMKECAAVGYKNGESGFWDAQAILCRILGLLLASNPTAEGHYKIALSGNPENQPLSHRVNACLHAKIDCIVTLGDIAEELGISVSTLTHQYQKETGIAPMKAFAQMKMDRIRELLKMGYPAKLITRQMSFPDSSGLSKFFKQNAGISPREFCSTENT